LSFSALGLSLDIARKVVERMETLFVRAKFFFVKFFFYHRSYEKVFSLLRMFEVRHQKLSTIGAEATFNEESPFQVSRRREMKPLFSTSW